MVMIIIFFLISSALAHNVVIYPETPAVVDLHNNFTFMCKSDDTADWRSTLFYDETEKEGLSSIGLFHKNADGTCKQSITSNKYHASCDIQKGEFNLTIRNMDEQHHGKMVSCTTQFGNGTLEDMHVTKYATLFVKVPVSSINLSVTDIITDVSTIYTITCSVVSRPAATITWMKVNSKDFETDITTFSKTNVYDSYTGETVSSVLSTTFSKLDNNGFLLCKANNSFSFRQSHDISLQIYYPPENTPIVTQVKAGPIYSGDVVNLHCSVYGGFPLVTLVWDCKGLMIDQSTETLSAVVVQFAVDRKDDGKICTCSTSHPDLSYKHKVQHTLTVYFSPSVPTLSSLPAMPWFVGNTTHVLCLSGEGNPKSEFQWIVNGQLTNENTSVLAIGPLTKDDNKKEIRCHVMNDYTKRKEIVLTSGPLLLNVEHYPEIIFHNNSSKFYAVEGENMTIICSTFGNPNPNANWITQDKRLTVPEESMSVLKIYRIKRHQQLFYCQAISVSTKFGHLVTNKSLEIRIYYRPNITKIEIQNSLITEGQTTTLRCQVDSNPVSNVSWIYTHNKTLLSETNHVSKSHLIISSAHCLDTGLFQCKAVTNILGKLYSTTAQTNLSVICGPRTDNRFPSLPDKMAVAINESLNLTVRLVAFPYPLLHWYHLKTKLSFSTNVFGSNVITNMLVPQVRKTDLGQYTINAINNAGSKSININIVEKAKPDIPSVLHLFCGSTTANIVWTIMFDGGDRQMFQVHYWAEENGDDKDESNYLDDPGLGKFLKFEMKGLREKTLYFFQITASNSLGESTTTVQCNTTGTYKQPHVKESSQTVIIPVTIVAVVAVVVICILLIKLVCNGRKIKGWINTRLPSRRNSQESFGLNSTSNGDGSIASIEGLTHSRSTGHSSTSTTQRYVEVVDSTHSGSSLTNPKSIVSVSSNRLRSNPAASTQSGSSITTPNQISSGSRKRPRSSRAASTQSDSSTTNLKQISSGSRNRPRPNQADKTDIKENTNKEAFSFENNSESLQSNA